MNRNGIALQRDDDFAPEKTGRAGRLLRAVLFATAAAVLVVSNQAVAQDWAGHGFDNSNSAFNPFEGNISTHNVGKLKTKWSFTTGGDVSARAAVVDGVVYFPDWGGNLWALDARTGKKIWGNQISTYLGSTTPVYARATPTISNGVLYIGTQQGAWFLAIDARSGNLLWKTEVETVDPLAIVTTSATVMNGVVYTGVASTQEVVPGGGGPARGSVVALDAWSGKILWKTYSTPTGYTGAGVWGSSPVVDPWRGLLYIGTGDNYSAPTDPNYVSCLAAPGGTAATCQSPNNHVDSLLAINIYTGAIKWSYRAVNWNQQETEGVANGSDYFNLSCLYGIPGCPSPQGPDYDFGQGPSEITYMTKWGPKTIVGIGQKSGIYYAFDPDSGALLWQTQVGPGSSLGGMEWGSATDGQRIYVAITNYYGIPWGGGTAGFWAALDPETGAILWKTADPNGAVDLGPVTVANGVVFVPSTGGMDAAGATETSTPATNPTMLALDASTGTPLWSFPAGSSVIAGATVSNGAVYWGSGYGHLGIPGVTSGNKFYAFSVNGN